MNPPVVGSQSAAAAAHRAALSSDSGVTRSPDAAGDARRSHPRTTGQRGESARQLVQLLTGALQHEMHLPELDAARLARGVLRWMSARAGGAAMYCPKTSAADRAERDAAIRREFNERSLAEICRLYGVSKSSVFRIVRSKE